MRSSAGAGQKEVSDASRREGPGSAKRTSVASEVEGFHLVVAHELNVGLARISDVLADLVVDDPLELASLATLRCRMRLDADRLKLDPALVERGQNKLVHPERRRAVKHRVLAVEARVSRGRDNVCEKKRGFGQSPDPSLHLMKEQVRTLVLVKPAVARLLADPEPPAEVDESALLVARDLLLDGKGLSVVERDNDGRRLDFLNRRLVGRREG
jgi:hypothetical protein